MLLLQHPLSLSSSPTFLSLTTHWSPHHRRALRLLPPIRMGGGPRTFPGGVSKWQWKRMQAKKSKQLLKARLLRERQLYEMRKRSELRAAISNLEKPWELVEKAPTIFSVSADEQLKALADRFQKPGGFDMWSERDGPRVIKNGEVLPSQRFFPKGVVHGVRPYGVMEVDGDDDSGEGFEGFDDWIARGGGGVRKRRRRRERREGVRGNAKEKMEEECVDVTTGAVVVAGNSEKHSLVQSVDVGAQLGYVSLEVGMDQLSLKNLKNFESDNGGQNGRNMGRSHTGRGGGRHWLRGEKSVTRSMKDSGSENLKGLGKGDGRRSSYTSFSGGYGRRDFGLNHQRNDAMSKLQNATDSGSYEGHDQVLSGWKRRDGTDGVRRNRGRNL